MDFLLTWRIVHPRRGIHLEWRLPDRPLWSNNTEGEYKTGVRAHQMHLGKLLYCTE